MHAKYFPTLIKPFLFLVLVVLLMYSCGKNEKPNTSTPAVDIALTEAEEDDLLLRLSPYLIADPETLADQENNTIVEYAIEQQWDVSKTRTGLFYQVLEAGDGPNIQWGDRVAATYMGRYLDGQIFDQRAADNPLVFYVGNMIDGWNEGLQQIAPGGRLRLLIPSALAYGEAGIKTGKGRTIVAENAILIFDLTVVEQVSE